MMITDLVPRGRPARLSRLALAAALLVGAAGCSEEIAPPDALDAYYTLWGAFDPQADVQRVRVVPITGTIGLGTPDPLPVTVSSLDLVSGEETAWADSVVAFANGTFGHVYQARFRPAFGSRHLFRVIDAGGRVTSAIVTVPALIEPIRQTTEASFGVTYPVLWPDAPRLNQVRAIYTLGDPLCQAVEMENALPGAAAGPVEFGWLTRLNLQEQAAELAPRLGFQPFTVREIELRVEVASEDWRPPGGVFDPDVLVEPGTLSNVSNGFGFIGSAYAVSVSWRPTAEELSRASLRPPNFGC